MKRFALVILLLLLILSAAACQNWVAGSYLVVEDHVEQSLPTQERLESEEPSVVTNRNELRGAVLSLIRNWTERAEILVQNYDGGISDDLAETITYAMQSDPVGAYAVDYIDSELTGDAASGKIALSIVFRRSAAEIDAIVTVSDNEAAYLKIQQALSNYETALTLRIRSYREADISAYIRDYCLANPAKVVCVPETSAELYPNEGETRILELHFTYRATRDEMRLMLSSTQSIFNSASSYIRSGETDAERADLLFRFLTTRFAYEISSDVPTTPAYDLLCQHLAHSLSFACVFSAECRATGIDCILVDGTRDGVEHYWNLLCLDGVYYHVDLMRSVEKEETALTLLTSKELRDEGYDWDVSLYPAAQELPEEAVEASVRSAASEQPPETSEPEVTETLPTEATDLAPEPNEDIHE